MDPVALEPMGFALESGRWLDTTVINAQSKKITVLVCEYTGYNFYDSRRSDNSPKRYRWQGRPMPTATSCRHLWTSTRTK